MSATAMTGLLLYIIGKGLTIPSSRYTSKLLQRRHLCSFAKRDPPIVPLPAQLADRVHVQRSLGVEQQLSLGPSWLGPPLPPPQRERLQRVGDSSIRRGGEVVLELAEARRALERARRDEA